MANAAERINVVQFPSKRGFVKLSNDSETLQSLLRQGKHKEFVLLTVIALRARRTEDPISGLRVGECFLGDYKACGLTERGYRTAKQNLEKWGLATFKPTNKGTVATIANTAVYDINADKPTDKTTGDRRTSDEQATTNKKDKNVRSINTSSDDERTEIIPAKRNTPPYQEIVNAYHRILPDLPRVVKISQKRKKAMSDRWCETVNLPNKDGTIRAVVCSEMAFWEKFFAHVETRDFLMGRKKDSSWCADFDFLLREDPFLKVLGGGYRNEH